MSKFGSDIRKELKKIHDEAATKVRKLLKSKKALLIYRVQFSAKESNNYKNSDIRKWLGNLISRFDDAMQKHFMQADIPYIDAYDEQIKIVSDKFWLLDQIELFTFYKTMDERKRTYLVDNAAAYWWLRTPYTGNTYIECSVTTSGSSSYNYISNLSFGCAPACLIG